MPSYFGEFESDVNGVRTIFSEKNERLFGIKGRPGEVDKGYRFYERWDINQLRIMTQHQPEIWGRLMELAYVARHGDPRRPGGVRDNPNTPDIDESISAQEYARRALDFIGKKGFGGCNGLVGAIYSVAASKGINIDVLGAQAYPPVRRTSSIDSQDLLRQLDGSVLRDLTFANVDHTQIEAQQFAEAIRLAQASRVA